MENLRPFLTGLCVFVIVTLVLYYAKSKHEREKESTQDILLRSVLPGVLLGGVVTVLFFTESFEIPEKLRNIFPKKKVYLEEDYFD